MGELNSESENVEEECKCAIAENLSELHLEPIASSDVDISKKDSFKLPLAQVASLGAGFLSLPEAFRTAVSVVDPSAGEQLYRAVLSPGATLMQGKDGLFSSSAKLLDGLPTWAKFEAVAPSPQVVTTTVPIDPATLAIAIALAQVNQKLDNLQDTLDELFDYLRIKDKADIRASLDTLSSVLADYHYNWSNQQFKQAKRILVQDINRDARQHIAEFRAHLSSNACKKGFIELRGKAADAAEEILDTLKDYQLAVYLYSFSTFLDVVLLENYDQAYLDSKAADIREKAFEYREAYTTCFDAIESRSEHSIDSFILGGVSLGLDGVGRLIEKTPIRGAASIGEAFAEAGTGVRRFDQKESDRVVGSLTPTKDPSVAPFAQSIEAINRVYNKPAQIVTDGQDLYFLPDG